MVWHRVSSGIWRLLHSTCKDYYCENLFCKDYSCENLQYSDQNNDCNRDAVHFPRISGRYRVDFCDADVERLWG